jgi:hypothetical protein
MVTDILEGHYYATLRDSVTAPQLASAFNRHATNAQELVLCETEYLRDLVSRRSTFARLSLGVVWRMLFKVVALALVIEHGALLRLRGISRRQFWVECVALADLVTVRWVDLPGAEQLGSPAPA